MNKVQNTYRQSVFTIIMSSSVNAALTVTVPHFASLLPYLVEKSPTFTSHIITKWICCVCSENSTKKFPTTLTCWCGKVNLTFSSACESRRRRSSTYSIVWNRRTGSVHSENPYDDQVPHICWYSSGGDTVVFGKSICIAWYCWTFSHFTGTGTVTLMPAGQDQ